MDIASLIQGTGARLVDEAKGPTRICDITDDSRSVMPGSLFIARPGVTHDGREHIPEAIRAGADAILTVTGTPIPDSVHLAWAETDAIALDTARIAERFFGNPSSKLTLIGATGTNGKTTIAHLVRQMLAGAVKIPTGLISTVEIDDGARTCPATLTTPGAIELSYTLATMVENGLQACAIEASSHALDQKRVGALDFDVAIFTNLSGDHLDYHRTIEAYARAKSRLFSMLRSDALAIINIDDAHAKTMLEACAAQNIITCSMSGAGDANATILEEHRTGTLVRFEGSSFDFEGRIPLVGAHNAMNTLQALVALTHLAKRTLELPAITRKLAPPPGRLEHVHPEGTAELPFSVFVDYAHTDDALRATLASLRPLTKNAHGRLHVVFGCGGDRDRTKRPRMAEVCCELADRVIITSDNPRTERPEAIIRDILGGVPDDTPAQVNVDADRAVAIQRAIQTAGREDIVVIAGKGHETEQILPDGTGGVRRIHFDDREVARDALTRRLASENAGAEGATV